MLPRRAVPRIFATLLLTGCAASATPTTPDGPTVPDAVADSPDSDDVPEAPGPAVDAAADLVPDLADSFVPTDAMPDVLFLDAAASEAPRPRDTAGDASAVDVPGCTGICNAATPVNPTVDGSGGTGNVTMYTTEPSNGGACNYGATDVSYFAAVNVNVSPGDGKGHWNGGRICGQCAEITAYTSRGPKSVVVRIMDRCPDVSCGMDLGGEAPATIMADGFGRYDGAWRFVACTGHPEVSDGAPSLFVVNGSNAWWSRVQIRNPPWAVRSIAWSDPAGTAAGILPFAADPENTYEVPAAVLQATTAALLVTVTYADGSTATTRLTPGDLASPGTSYPLE